MAKLKVFATRQGFFDTVVAAPSQKAALEAWGTHQNLFAQGLAEVAKDAAAAEAALAAPGEVLRRAVGAAGPFSAEGGRPSLPNKPKAKSSRSRGAVAPKTADRTSLDAAEAALHEAEERRRRETERLQQQRDRLAQELEALERRMSEQTEDAERNLRALRNAVEREARAFARAQR